MKQFHKILFNSQIGKIKLTCDGKNVIALTVVNDDYKDTDIQISCSVCQNAVYQLQEYFSGDRTVFDLPVQLDGPPMYRCVWDYLKTIPYGKTVSYSEAAAAVGCKSVRAVATAIGKNPVPIIVPCHRVIHKDGTMGEFSLVGPAVKEFLLNLEQCKFSIWDRHIKVTLELEAKYLESLAAKLRLSFAANFVFFSNRAHKS